MRHEGNRGISTVALVLIIVGGVFVVFVLIGVVAALLGSQMSATVGKGRRIATRNQIRELEEAVEMYRLTVDAYPARLDELLEPKDGFWAGFLKADEIPLDPWGSAYEYSADGGLGDIPFRIWSKGEDGVSGTEDDIDNLAGLEN